MQQQQQQQAITNMSNTGQHQQSNSSSSSIAEDTTPGASNTTSTLRRVQPHSPMVRTAHHLDTQQFAAVGAVCLSLAYLQHLLASLLCVHRLGPGNTPEHPRASVIVRQDAIHMVGVCCCVYDAPGRLHVVHDTQEVDYRLRRWSRSCCCCCCPVLLSCESPAGAQLPAWLCGQRACARGCMPLANTSPAGCC